GGRRPARTARRRSRLRGAGRRGSRGPRRRAGPRGTADGRLRRGWWAWGAWGVGRGSRCQAFVRGRREGRGQAPVCRSSGGRAAGDAGGGRGGRGGGGGLRDARRSSVGAGRVGASRPCVGVVAGQRLPATTARDYAPCRFLTSESTTDGSARVLVSPSWSGAFSAILRRIRRMILPERVFGRPGAHCRKSGDAIGPISLRTCATSSLSSSSLSTSPATRVT